MKYIAIAALLAFAITHSVNTWAKVQLLEIANENTRIKIEVSYLISRVCGDKDGAYKDGSVTCGKQSGISYKEL